MGRLAARVLLAEDDSMVRRLLAAVLHAEGLDVVEASDGAEACRLIDAPDNLDLVITDLRMPGADGVAVAQRARAHVPSLPVLFVSGRPDLLAKVSDAIPHSSIAKPFRLDQFTAAVRAMLPRSLHS
jgi:DNA-binding response OmpR family regulator